MDEERLFRNYMADALYFNGQGKAHSQRFKDLIQRKPVNSKDPEDIIAEVVAKGGLTILKEEMRDADI